MCLRPVDIVPHDQNILDESHLLDDAELILHILIDPVALFLRIGIIICIFFFKSLIAERTQEFIRRCISFRNFVLRNLVISKFNRHMTAICDLLRIIHCFLRIWKKRTHLVLTFDVELSPLIAHTILIRNLLTGLDAKEHIVRLHIVRIGVMHIIRAYKPDPSLLTHAHQLLVHNLLIRNPMVLQLQEEIALAKTRLIF